MKRSLLLITVISISFVIISCKKEDAENDNCNFSNPTEELIWLKTMVTDMDEYSYIKSATYNGETVFFNGNCDPLANSVSSVYNCSGEVIGYTNDLYDDLSEIKLEWEHENSMCNFSD